MPNKEVCPLKGKRSYAYIASFIAMLLIPLALTPFSRMTDVGAPADFDAFFDSSFGLRNEMITLNAHILAPLGASGARQVTLGRDGWLFFGETLDDYVGATLDGEAITAASRKLAKLNERARAASSLLIVAIAPNKASIYPEYMPFYIQRSHAPGNRALLESALAAEGVAVCALYDALVAAKPLYDVPLYHKEDTHWNNLGAAVAARALMEAIAARDASFAYADLVPERIDVTYDWQGDLHRMLYPAEAGRDMQVTAGAPGAYTSARPIHTGEEQYIETFSDAGPHALYMLRDSFANALIQYLSGAFGRAVYTRSMDMDFDMPAGAVVVIEVAERRIPALCEALDNQ